MIEFVTEIINANKILMLVSLSSLAARLLQHVGNRRVNLKVADSAHEDVDIKNKALETLIVF